MDDIPSYRAETRGIDALKPPKWVFGSKFQGFRPQTSAKSGSILSDIRHISIGCKAYTKKTSLPEEIWEEELVCGGLGKEETLHLMGFPSNALSINNTSGLREQLLKNLKSCESNTQHALDEKFINSTGLELRRLATERWTKTGSRWSVNTRNQERRRYQNQELVLWLPFRGR